MFAEANTYAGQYAEQLVDRPYLARISDYANEVENAALRVTEFIARCRGGGTLGANSANAPIPTGHFAQLDRLGQAVAELEKLTRELGSIG